MMLAAREGEQTSFVKPTAILIQSAQASQMKSLVHAYMVRYILPRRKKKEEEEKAKNVNKETDVVPFATDGA